MDQSSSASTPEASGALPAAGSSVEDKCPICLDDYHDKAFINVCFHAFCFDCVVRAASMTGNVCPLCKVKYYKVIHNVKANDIYDIHKISRFQKPSDSSSSEVSVTISSLRERTAAARTVAAAIGGRGGRSSRKASVHSRRCVYSSGVKARLPDPTNGRPRRIRDISASFFRTHPASTHRLVPWLNREIEALLGAEHVSFIVRLVLSILERVDLEGEEFPSHLYDFLGSRTSHFMHEFVSYAKSPYDMIAYDEKVVYDWPHGVPMETNRSSLITEASSSSSSHLMDPNLPSTSSGEASVDVMDVDTNALDMRHRLFQELTSGEGVSGGVASTYSSPLQFCNSPIVIHGSSSEDEDEYQGCMLEYRDDGYPSYPQAIPNELPLRTDVATSRTARIPRDTTSYHSNSSINNAGVPPSQASTSLDSQGLAEEPAESTDQIELFVSEHDAGTYSGVVEGLSGDGKGKKASKVCMELTEGSGEGSSRIYFCPDHASKDAADKSSDRVKEKPSKRHKKSKEMEKEKFRRINISDEEDRQKRAKFSRRKHPRRDRSRSRSNQRSNSHTRKEPSLSNEKIKERGKGKLGTSLEDDRKRKCGRPGEACSPVVVISDSDSEREHHHHHYHHHTHKHKHKHKHKKHKNKSRKHRKRHSSSTSLANPSHSVPSKELLVQESKVIQEEIEISKKEILKSSLRKERMELLHSCLHGQHSPGRELCGTGQGGPAEGKAKELSEQELEAQLASIEKDIVKEKQQLLKVMTSLEQIQHSDD